MKKFSSHKGFTLVELMIVIAIIGILAAVLYPAMTGYFERSRDTNRQKALNNTSLSLVTYYNDNSSYPTIASPTGCLDDVTTKLLDDNGTSYIKAIQKDPSASKAITGQDANPDSITTCFGGTKTGYGYKALDTNGSFALAAIMENRANANFNASLSAASTSGAEQGANAKKWSAISSIKDIEPAFSAAKNSVVSAKKTNLLYVVGQ